MGWGTEKVVQDEQADTLALLLTRVVIPHCLGNNIAAPLTTTVHQNVPTPNLALTDALYSVITKHITTPLIAGTILTVQRTEQ